MTPHRYFVRQQPPGHRLGDLGVWSWVQETFGSKPDSPASERGIRPPDTGVTTACTFSIVELQKGLLNSGLSVGSSRRSGGREQPDGEMGPTTRRSLAAFAARVAPGVDLTPVVSASSVRLFNAGLCAALRSSAAGFQDPARPSTSSGGPSHWAEEFGDITRDTGSTRQRVSSPSSRRRWLAARVGALGAPPSPLQGSGRTTSLSHVEPQGRRRQSEGHDDKRARRRFAPRGPWPSRPHPGIARPHRRPGRWRPNRLLGVGFPTGRKIASAGAGAAHRNFAFANMAQADV